MAIKQEIRKKIKKLRAGQKVEVNKDYVFTKINQKDFDLVEQTLNINLPNDYKWFITNFNGLNVDGMTINGIVEYEFEPDEKSYDIIEETKLFQKQAENFNSKLNLHSFISLNTEDSDYLVLYDVEKNQVGIFSSVPEFFQIGNNTSFLKFIDSILDDYLED